MGLYGNVLVEPADPAYWPACDREVLLTLDDVLIEDGDVAPFNPHGANYAAMGRFGNVLLIGGETEQRMTFRRGEVVRIHLTNTANTRVFNITVPGLSMKLVGSDSGRYEREGHLRGERRNEVCDETATGHPLDTYQPWFCLNGRA